ncbi:hypothetical protein HID58_054708, partial [Brassica napus]
MISSVSDFFNQYVLHKLFISSLTPRIYPGICFSSLFILQNDILSDICVNVKELESSVIIFDNKLIVNISIDEKVDSFFILEHYIVFKRLTKDKILPL